MKCSELMKTDVECSSRREPVIAVARRMRDRNIGFVPVCDDQGAVLGTLTDRDLVIRVLAEERPPDRTTAEEVMTTELVYCSPEDDLEIAEDLMARYQKSRIVVLDEGRHPVGVISLSDILRVEDAVKAAKVLSSVASREAPITM